MSVKTILTYLPTAKRAPAILDAGFALCERHGAHLIALHIHPSLYSPSAVADDIPTGILEMLIDARSKEASTIQKAFHERASAHDVVSEWRNEEALHGDTTQDIIDNALCADLIITTPTFGDQFDTWSDRPARIVMGSGRPVLMVPDDNTKKTIGKRVTLAWNQSPEAARAAFDAIPLIQDADIVEVVSICEEDGNKSLPAGDELALVLARHGVATEAVSIKGADANAGDELLAYAQGKDCNLLVMGCYGHSRVRELIFGGATRDVLQTATIPVLMSH